MDGRSPFNGYRLTLKVPGDTQPVFLNPDNGGCGNHDQCKTAKGYASPTITYVNSIYALREVVFHTPAEHTFDGVAPAMEVQLVSELVDCVKCTCPGWGSNGYGGPQWCCCTPNNNDKTRLVQSLFMSPGQPGGAPGWVSDLAAVATSVNGEPRELVPSLFFRDISVSMHNFMSKYFFYDGSLTEPPCLKAVQWLIIKRIVDIKNEDLNAIRELSVGGNARPVQPIKGRKLSIAGSIQL